MPNWCSNYLEITAEPPVIAALLAKAKGKASPECDVIREFSYLPFFQEQIDACEDYEAQWYEFMLGKVGCKWFPVIEPDAICVTENRIGISFESPWSPPIAGTSVIADWLRKQGFVFQLQLTYEESGCAYCGVFTADEDGEEDQCGDYAELDADMLREGKEEDYEDVCKSFDISFTDLQARATEDTEYVTLCPEFYREHAR